MNYFKRRVWTSTVIFLFLALPVVWLAGCSVIEVDKKGVLSAESRWSMLPIMNYSISPQAGKKVEAVLATALRARGVDIIDYPVSLEEVETLTELVDKARYNKALAWAKQNGFTYGVSGSVEEYRYKIGLDGEPVVGVTFRIIDLKSGKIVASVSGSQSGWGRSALSATAHKLIMKMVDRVMLAK